MTFRENTFRMSCLRFVRLTKAVLTVYKSECTPLKHEKAPLMGGAGLYQINRMFQHRNHLKSNPLSGGFIFVNGNQKQMHGNACKSDGTEYNKKEIRGRR